MLGRQNRTKHASDDLLKSSNISPPMNGSKENSHSTNDPNKFNLDAVEVKTSSQIRLIHPSHIYDELLSYNNAVPCFFKRKQVVTSWEEVPLP
jgi:hypothetical protein